MTAHLIVHRFTRYAFFAACLTLAAFVLYLTRLEPGAAVQATGLTFGIALVMALLLALCNHGNE